MLKDLSKTVMALSVLVALSPAQAIEQQCDTFSADSGALVSSACEDIWSELDASGQFPEIFADNKLLPGFCFVSDGAIEANMGDTPVHITTISAWTSEFLPFQFGLGGDSMGTVITRWTVTTAADNILLGDVYTRDAIDMTTSSEVDVIIDGSMRLSNAKGAFRVDSVPEFFPNGAVRVNLVNLAGTVCAPG